MGQRDFIKILSNDNYVYIVYQRVLSPWDRTQALTYAIRAVSLPWKSIASDIQYIIKARKFYFIHLRNDLKNSALTEKSFQ